MLACFQTIEPCAPENSCKFETWLGIQNKKMTGESPEVRSDKRKPREKKKENREKKRENEREKRERERKRENKMCRVNYYQSAFNSQKEKN